ncbi:trk system potassium uptake protein TrkA [Actinobaculum suis]|uniref:Trk family potassium transport protein NAD-binding component n=1 Tax=Actinobaculum suis TaxID=1657 RepID=A0A0K9ETF5_9ACTO|nr:TrkA family potassium uptake protein [Actinobaculum suis]KMY23107.1 hypothetical protein ACU19_05945 [Actinobaculum suis]MDY5152822.1 TrkA family potassium uptake protein [Actinobaculum suis]OCA95437.1 hypothetical protein ACU21_03845 [Actinobaculum suis]SDE45349.1 trk system potassium uptake protein TrkA [Actinobaculum suis]VDG77245.1 Trk family potassium transport protein NAD-binding component [Actinobaculum suis]
MVSFAKPTYAILGLGRFGTALARELMAGGATVVGVDANEAKVAHNNGILSQVVCADSTDIQALSDLGIDEFTGVVVAIGGEHVEASILTCSLLRDMNVTNLWAKSSGTAHDRILRQIGIPHIVYPEVAMGRRIAHLLLGASLDYVELSDGMAIIQTAIPARLAARPIDENRLWRREGVKIISQLTETGWQPIIGQPNLAEGTEIQAYGPIKRLDTFAKGAVAKFPKNPVQ